MQLEICENGYLVCEEGKVKVCIRLCRILTPGFQSKITETGFDPGLRPICMSMHRSMHSAVSEWIWNCWNG